MKKFEQKQKELEAILKSRNYQIPKIKIVMDLDSINSLGQCVRGNGEFTIRLNPDLYKKIGQDYVDEIFVHEYAHAVTNTNYSYVKSHGREFKGICRMFNIEGKSTSNILSRYKISMKSKMKNIFYYKCDCLGFKELTALRHNKIMKGTASYSCSICKKKLEFVK